MRVRNHREYGNYEVPGSLERRFNPYAGFGLEPGETPSPWTPTEPPVIQGAESGIQDLANQVMCTVGGGTWDPQAKICTKAGTAVHPPAELCAKTGGTYDLNTNQCIPPQGVPLPPPKEPPKKDNTTTIAVVAVVGLFALAWAVGGRG